MGFEKGHKKIGGRKKGTQNRTWENIEKCFLENRFDPAEFLLKILPGLNLDRQADICLHLMPFKYPKMRSQEKNIDNLSGLSDESLENIIEEYQISKSEIYKVKL